MPSEFSNIEVQKQLTDKNNRKLNKNKMSFYEVDLSEEEQKKDNKSTMSLRRKNKRRG